MNVAQLIKSMLGYTSSAAPAKVVSSENAPLDTGSYAASFAAKRASDLLLSEENSARLLTQYGEFSAFFHRPDFNHFLHNEILPFLASTGRRTRFLEHDHWQEKYPFNFPGPFYTGESDTCGTGTCEAPENVILDANYCEYVFRQPTTYYALVSVLDAAAVEVLDSYSANGNDHWTYLECKTWWRSRENIISSLADEKVVRMNDGQAQLYLAYLNGAAELDLRRYCYFLEHGVYPVHQGVLLPEL